MKGGKERGAGVPGHGVSLGTLQSLVGPDYLSQTFWAKQIPVFDITSYERHASQFQPSDGKENAQT
eukprot:3174586-Rhodomonas_salina.2